MSIATTWGVVLEVPGADSAFEVGRDAYLARCPRLAAVLADAGASLSFGAASTPTTPAAGTISVGISVTEVLPTSFVMAVRLRDADGVAFDGRVSVTIRDASGAVLPIPRDVRDEFIALQLGARDYL